MSRDRLADAFDALAEAAATVSIELRANDPSGARPDVPVAGDVPPAPAPAARPRQQEESAFTECPAHRKAWVDGRYGKYCPGQEPEGQPHDGNWYNDKGYCRVTPRSAGAWLKQHPRAA